MSHADDAPNKAYAAGEAGVRSSRVVVVDDHPLWREALSRDLADAGFTVVGTAGSVAQALRVVAATRPDLVVLDLGLPDGSGVEVIRALVGSAPSSGTAASTSTAPSSSTRASSGTAASSVRLAGARVSVLVVSASGEQADVLEAVKAGASGYLVKSARPEELVDAVRRTAEGVAVFSAGLAALVLGEMSRAARDSGAGTPATGTSTTPPLTVREIEVLRLVAKGLSARDAARQLGVSHRTVQNHVHNVLGKLQLRNRVELTRFAVREGYDDAS